MTGEVRRPAHAGSFYPASPEALRRLVDALLTEAQLAGAQLADALPTEAQLADAQPATASPTGPGTAGATPAMATPAGAPRVAGLRPPQARPVGLVVPHAGLVYSGRVAAAAWGLLRASPPTRS